MENRRLAVPLRRRGHNWNDAAAIYLVGVCVLPGGGHGGDGLDQPYRVAVGDGGNPSRPPIGKRTARAVADGFDDDAAHHPRNARPAYEYQPFYQPDNLYTRMFSPIDASRLQSRSSLITLDTPLIRLHFQYEADGSVSSPQVPTQSWRDFAEAQHFTTFERIEAYSRELKELKDGISWSDLDAALPDEIEAEPEATAEQEQLAEIQPNAAADLQMEHFADAKTGFRNNSRSRCSKSGFRKTPAA